MSKLESTRPEDLPDFRKPPLNEVVLGVQFTPVLGYQQIRAGEVWALFRDEFPNVRELPALPPSFETFGPAGPVISQINFQLVSGPTYNRFWFLSQNGEELIQFQLDRLLHNWRKVGDQTNPYPRFELIIGKFEKELVAIQDYFSRLYSSKLAITQCEVSYINHILFVDQLASISAGEWIRFFDFGSIEPDDFSFNCRWTISAASGRPQGRLICEASTAVNQTGHEMIVLTLTARGVPLAANIPAALDFLKMGRELIVKRFAGITTDSAHRQWERVQ